MANNRCNCRERAGSIRLFPKTEPFCQLSGSVLKTENKFLGSLLNFRHIAMLLSSHARIQTRSSTALMPCCFPRHASDELIMCIRGFNSEGELPKLQNLSKSIARSARPLSRRRILPLPRWFAKVECFKKGIVHFSAESLQNLSIHYCKRMP